jgi:S-adenosylmethionine synthetase
LKEAVKRNLFRFPEDFMFELTNEEFTNWRSQIATSNSDRMGLRYTPMVFTEHGVLMLSSVLNSKKAISINIQIMRIFTRIRQMRTDALSLNLEMEEIKKKLRNQDKNIELVFSYLDELITKQQNKIPRNRIGFKANE